MAGYEARCVWYWRFPPKFRWEAQPEPNSATCRVAVGDKLVTVWLPQGAKIRCRRVHDKDVVEQTFRSAYGGDRDRMVQFTIHPVDKAVEERDKQHAS